MSSVSSETITLKTNLSDSPVTRAIKDGSITSSFVNLNFCGPKVAHDGFKAMIREHAFEAGELAIVTYLQAKIYNKPFVLLPLPVSGKAQHPGVGYNKEFGHMDPKDIEGKKVGVRTYSQTTGLWLRGILQHDFGVDLNKVNWLTTDVSHLAEYTDPPNCQLLPKGTDLGKMMLDGEIAAGILGIEMPKDPRVETLIPNAVEAGKEWVRREGVVPINHLFVVRAELSKERPEVVREIYRMLVESRNQAPESVIAALPAYGFKAIQKTINMAIDWAYEQKIIPRKLSMDELFDDTTGTLN
jgi:4,5-dihydroxyphthalate decarboxylase